MLHRLRGAVAEDLGEEELCPVGPRIGHEVDMEAEPVVAGVHPPAGEGVAVHWVQIREINILYI